MKFELVGSDELFERMFAVHHTVIVDLLSVGTFEEWAPLEILAMRVFADSPGAIGAADVARRLGCSLPHASRLTRKLRERGLVGEFRWHRYRSLSKTIAGQEWVRRELPYLTHFTEGVFARLSQVDRATLFEVLGRVSCSASL